MERFVIDMQISDSERARQQGERLRALRDARGISKGRLMDALRLTTTNGYDLYERGKSVIRLDRVSEWAAAFEITEQEFLDAVLEPSKPAPMFADETDDPAWDFLAELKRVWIGDMPGFDQLYEGLRDQSQAIQRSVVASIRDAAQHEHGLAAPGQQPRPPSAERAEYRYGRTG